MHSKVIIASLVFGLSLGFAAVSNKSVGSAKPKEETYVLQKQENNQTRGAAVRVPVIDDGGGGGSHTHVYNYSYTPSNDGKHYANCNCGASTLQEHVFDAYYPNGHGHNDMLHCALCDTNVWMTALQSGFDYPDSFTSQAARWYYFMPVTSGTYVFETTGSTDTYGELYLGNYPTTRTTYNDDGGANTNFRISIYLTAWQNVFLRVRGFAWGAATYSLSVTEYHEHDYSIIEDYNESNHKEICSICGDTRIRPHAYNIVASYNNAYHTMKCACGRTSARAEHTYCEYLPYGHGHNDLIRCSVCQNNIECARLEQGYSYSNSVYSGNAKWYIFIPQTSGTYTFETTGSSDTYGELYLGDYPTTRTTYNDDGGVNLNFRITRNLVCGEPAFLRVRGYNWNSATYSISVVEEQPAPQPNPTREWTIMFYMCGSTLESGGGNNSSGNITDAITKILDVPNKPTNVNVIIEAGGCTDWQQYNIPDNQISRYYVNNGQLCVDNIGVSYDRYASMGAQSTFQAFLNWGLTYYPANKTGVILMNHGGAMSGVCFDTVHNEDSLTNAEANQAFRNVLGENPTSKLEFIQYDACLMGLQDVARYNSKYFNYMVASENEVTEDMVTGVSANWLAGLYAGQPTLTFLETMIDDFIRNGCGWEQTSTILDLSKMNGYYNAFETLASKINDTIRNQDDRSALYNLVQGSGFPYCPCSNSYNYCVSDCFLFLNKLKQEWYNSAYITPYVDNVLSYFPNESDYEVDWDADFRHVEARSDGLVKYHAASLGYAGGIPVTHGLSVHFGYYDIDNQSYFPNAESDFNNWRNIVLYQ